VKPENGYKNPTELWVRRKVNLNNITHIAIIWYKKDWKHSIYNTCEETWMVIQIHCCKKF